MLNCRRRASGSPRGEKVGVRPQGPPCPAVVGWEGQEEQVAGGGRQSRGGRVLRVGLGSQALGWAPGPGERGGDAGLVREDGGPGWGLGPQLCRRPRYRAPVPTPSASRTLFAPAGWAGGFCGGASGPPRVAAQSCRWRHLVAPARPAGVSAAVSFCRPSEATPRAQRRAAPLLPLRTPLLPSCGTWGSGSTSVKWAVKHPEWQVFSK